MGRDANHNAITKRFKDGMASVADLSGVGKGVPDIVVGHAGLTTLVEIKLPEGKRGGTAHSQLNNRQKSFHNHWAGMTPMTVRTDDDVDSVLLRMEALGRVMRAAVHMSDGELTRLAAAMTQQIDAVS